ncbi:MAG: DUF6151 family protein [Hyphomonadaceae bacterium]|nr:DUF6151 family protein [Hyphomonadaceae bacterium]
MSAPMANDLVFQCRCGSVAGVLHDASARTGLRYVCHCDDCQAYAHHLGRADMLDPAGGTAAYQTNASRLRITRGLDKLASMKVAKLAMRPALRWYAACCSTPLFATFDTGQRSFFVLLLANTDPKQADALLGPSLGIVWRKFAAGDVSDRKDASIPAILWRMLTREMNARLNGDWRNTPLFDPATGKPIAVPYQITPEERAKAEASIAKLSSSSAGPARAR